MKTKVSPALVGAFALGAFIILVIAAVAFGSADFLHKRERFMVYFTGESAQGLTKGSPVKLSGVSVGRVIDLHVRYDAATNHSAVAVLCEFDRNVITDMAGRVIDVTNRQEVQTLVDRGLRAQLGFLGLATGLLYIELEFVDPHQYPAASTFANVDYPTVPQMPSSFNELYTSANELMGRLAQVDFPGLARDLQALLQDTRRQLDRADIAGLIAQWKATGASIDQLARSPEFLQTLGNLNATLADVRTAVDRLNGQVDQTGQSARVTLVQAQAALKQFAATAATLQRFIAAQQGLGDNATQALLRVSDAADSVRRLADFLERNPNALIVGRKESP